MNRYIWVDIIYEDIINNEISYIIYIYNINNNKRYKGYIWIDNIIIIKKERDIYYKKREIYYKIIKKEIYYKIIKKERDIWIYNIWVYIKREIYIREREI